jgi:hypothetical protein
MMTDHNTAMDTQKIVAQVTPHRHTPPETRQQVVSVEREEATPNAEPRTRKRSRRNTTAWQPPVKPEYKPFADALRSAMERLDMSASELARQIWGTTVDNRGRTVARNRDRVGHYLAGTSYPEPDNLEKLASALGVPVETLTIERPAGAPAPRGARSTTAASTGTLSMTSLPAQPTKIRLVVDRVIPWEVADHIHRLLKQVEIGEAVTIDETLGEIVGGTDTETKAETRTA